MRFISAGMHSHTCKGGMETGRQAERQKGRVGGWEGVREAPRRKLEVILTCKSCVRDLGPVPVKPGGVAVHHN